MTGHRRPTSRDDGTPRRRGDAGLRRGAGRPGAHPRCPRGPDHRADRPQRVWQEHAAARHGAAAEAPQRGDLPGRSRHPRAPDPGGRHAARACCRSRRSSPTASPWRSWSPAGATRTSRGCGSGRPTTSAPSSAPCCSRARRACAGVGWTSSPAGSGSGRGSPSRSPRRRRLLLLDEPTTYLDLAHQVEVLDLLHRLNREEGRTIVLVIHDLNLAARYADHLVAMAGARSGASGTPAEVLTERLMRDVFGLECRVIPDPTCGAPLVLPIARTESSASAPTRHPATGGSTQPMNRRSLALSVAAASLVAAVRRRDLFAVCPCATPAASSSAAPTSPPRRPLPPSRRHPPPTAYPLTIEHKHGSTTIDKAPERIVTVGLLEQDPLLALGVTPVGTTEWFGEHPGRGLAMGCGSAHRGAADGRRRRDRGRLRADRGAQARPDPRPLLRADQGAVRPAGRHRPDRRPAGGVRRLRHPVAGAHPDGRRDRRQAGRGGRARPRRRGPVRGGAGRAPRVRRAHRRGRDPLRGRVRLRPGGRPGPLPRGARLQASRGSGRGHRRAYGGNLSAGACRHARRRRDRLARRRDAEGDLGGPLYDSLKVHTEGREVHLTRSTTAGRCDVVRDRAQPAVPAGRHRPEAGGGDRWRPGDGGAVTGPASAPAAGPGPPRP